MRTPRPKKADPAANMFAIGISAQGNECSIARVDTMEALRGRILANMANGLYTEVVILNLRQLGPIIERITG